MTSSVKGPGGPGGIVQPPIDTPDRAQGSKGGKQSSDWVGRDPCIAF